VFSVRLGNSCVFTISAFATGSISDHTDLEFHADTGVGGPNCVLLSETGKTVMVHTFSNKRQPFAEVKIGMTGTAWVNLETGETFILIHHQRLYFGDMVDHSLECPNQL